MEDDEELTPEPDENGILVLSNRAWVHLDPIIWSYNMKLVRLDVSYNHLTELPVQIGEMVMLRELIASFNKITLLPSEIGKLRRLKRLVLNNNRIKILPAEVGNMEMLEDLLLNENLIEDLPTTIAKMTNLRVLKLTSNRLRSLPFEIANILSLEELDCGNNPHLTTVPAKWRGDTESLLFTCRLHRGTCLYILFDCNLLQDRLVTIDYNIQMAELNIANGDLSKHAQMVEEDNIILKVVVLCALISLTDGLIVMHSRIDELNRNMPKKIVKKMEAAAKRAAEQELLAETQKEERHANKCIIC
eukprot:scaffold5444_cov181-Ochromonas_danica.AAC.14